MAKDPAVLFYTSDFLTGTMTLSDEQTGKYIKLLCLQHQKFELTEKDMMNICKSYDEDIFSKFIKTDTGYYNERMREEAEKRKRYSESRSSNRKNHMNNTSKSYEQHMENEIEIVIKDEVITNKGDEGKVELWPSFNDFWDAYDKKTDRAKCEKKWDKLKQSEKEAILAYLPSYTATTPDKQYRKNPETFLNNRSWENELIVKTELIKKSKFEINAENTQFASDILKQKYANE